MGRRKSTALMSQLGYIDVLTPSFVGAKGLIVHPFATQEEFFKQVKTNVTQDFCFGFEISDVQRGVKEINITYMFP